ncbi:MAG: MgtC/SapB family protein [Oscillospiraceae bacterium]|nr:MgtC/SapB family protein [Oscillospiraceae bacterium]
MIHALDPLREFTFATALLRLLLALVCGVVIGYGRSKMQRTAGMRTYVLVAVGACMAVLITVFQYNMFQTAWAGLVEEVGLKYDASRMASQAVAGIGFLGAGIIIKASHQQVTGLTTATGLFATVCLSMAAGAGFYELVLLSALMVVLVLNVMMPLEVAFKRRVRNITLCVEFNDIQDLNTISLVMQGQHAVIFDVDVERSERDGDKYPSAVFIVQLSKLNHSHSGMLSSVAELSCVRSVRELIA